MSIEARLTEMGIVLPQPAAPIASYVPVVVQGDLAYVSGQLPFVDGDLVTGTLGDDVSLEDGAAAARACGLMILAQLRGARIPAGPGAADREAGRIRRIDARFHRISPKSPMARPNSCSTCSARSGVMPVRRWACPACRWARRWRSMPWSRSLPRTADAVVR